MSDERKTEDRTFDILSEMIDNLFSTHYNKENKMENQPEPAPQQQQTQSSDWYESIEQYTTKTGKRFRMLKEQKARNLTREQAFEELYGDSV